MGASSSTSRSLSTSDIAPPSCKIANVADSASGSMCPFVLRRVCMSDIPTLVDTRWLSAHQEVRIVDSRWSATGGSGQARYDEGHIPGAVFVDLDRDLSRPGGPGRHPFPSEAEF